MKEIYLKEKFKYINLKEKEKLKYFNLKGGLIEQNNILKKILSIGFEFESSNLFGLLKNKKTEKVGNLNATTRDIEKSIKISYDYKSPQDKLIIQYDNAPPNMFNINATLNLDYCPDKSSFFDLIPSLSSLSSLSFCNSCILLETDETSEIIKNSENQYTTRPKDIYSKLYINNTNTYNEYTKEILKIPIINEPLEKNLNIDLIDNMTGVRSCEFTYTIRQKDLIEYGSSNGIRRDNIILEGLKEAIDAIYDIFQSDEKLSGIFLGKITNIHQGLPTDNEINKCAYKTVTIPDETYTINILNESIYKHLVEFKKPRLDQPIYITEYNKDYSILFMNAAVYDIAPYEVSDFSQLEHINKYRTQIIDQAMFRIQATFSVELDDLFDVINYLAFNNYKKKIFMDDYLFVFVNCVKSLDKTTQNKIIDFDTFYNNGYIIRLIIIFIYLFITYVQFKNSEDPSTYLKDFRIFLIRNSFDNIFIYIQNKKKLNSIIETCESCGSCESCKQYELYSYNYFINTILNNFFKEKIINHIKYLEKKDGELEKYYTQIIESFNDKKLKNEYSNADNFSSRYNNNDIILVEYRTFWEDKIFSKNDVYREDNLNFFELRKKVTNKITQYSISDNIIIQGIDIKQNSIQDIIQYSI